ncbi:hybrid sensor histidine kinase/response regulator [Desulfopila aestuarii]|uniref:histidine kinase n=1 Tax=Desulfopila aestuarii DSM 18488 TaxID=1121416 RepID=A0A1M7YBG9_9BACT|nr:ATP-binding protein [Desulfopila aestuarii]SHO49952.1 PAS domain S-box-containing protein [Desulfopila aestuarii DSM 18488]
MSFRNKLSIAFSLVLLLTVIVSLTSWWGMQNALDSQKEVYGFQNHIERTFSAMNRQEQAFTAEETTSHSHLVFDHIAEMRPQIEKIQYGEKDQLQREQLAVVLVMLENYEKAFSLYVQQNLEMQTIRSRMEQEAGRLHSQVDELVLESPLGKEIDHLAITALLHQKEYALTHRVESYQQLTETIALLHQRIVSLRQKQPEDSVNLLAFRIDKTATTFGTIFKQFATQQENAAIAHDNLRNAFTRLSEEFSRAVATKTNLVNQHIAGLQALTISTALLAVMLSIAATLLLSEFITRPIDLLKKSALRIVSGDLSTSVEIRSKDEIGQLGELFNTMTDRLRANFEELNKYRDRLEDLVKERTHELELEIIERKETEKELAASEQRFRTIFDNSNDGVLIVEPISGMFVVANNTICNMLGYAEHELLSLVAMDIHPPQDREWVRMEFQKCAEGTSTIAKDIPILCKDGTVFPAEITAAFINIGEQKYMLGSFRDISERKAAEEERLKIRKLESVGVLAGGIAHDFNNILAAILGNVSLTMAYTDQDDKRFPLLKELEKASLRARDLTQQLLTFSKGGEPVKELTSVTEIIRESASFILRGSNVRCDFNFAENLWNAEVDAGQISQVIQNIVVNARYAMPDGGVVTITCRNTIPSPAMSEALAGQNCLEITLTDNGPGIAPEQIERIFDPYFTTKKSGSGLGLAITHSIIRKHNGAISVQSSPGKGTSFTILLPALDTILPPVKTQDQTLPRTAAGTIMVMDDEAPVRDITRQLLSHLGYSVITVADGNEAIDVYQQHLNNDNRVDLVIMDLTIPGGMGGKEAAEKILAMDPTARLIVSSGYSQDPIMANYALFGFRGFLSKPFHLKDLQHVLEQTLRLDGR